MKSEDLQKLLLSKYQAGQIPKKIFQDLNGAVSYRTIKRWCKMIRETGAIDLSKPSACHRTVHTKANIQKIKRKSKGGKRISSRRLALEMNMSFISAYRILRKDLKMKPYKNRYWRMSIKLSGKNSPIGRERSSGKRIQWESFFPMKNCLILTASITVKMIVYGPVNREEANWRDEKKTARKVSTKSYDTVSRMLRERCAPCSVWKRHSRSSSRKYCLLLHDMETVNLETTGPSNKTTEHHILTKRRKNGVPNISWQGYMASE